GDQGGNERHPGQGEETEADESQDDQDRCAHHERHADQRVSAPSGKDPRHSTPRPATKLSGNVCGRAPMEPNASTFSVTLRAAALHRARSFVRHPDWPSRRAPAMMSGTLSTCPVFMP